MSYRPSIVSHRSIDWNATPTEQLPRLPGEVGPDPIQPVIEYPGSTLDVFTRQAGDELTSTEVFERVVFPDVEPERPFAGMTKKELYAKAKQLGIPGRSKMTKAQLHAALLTHGG